DAYLDSHISGPARDRDLAAVRRAAQTIESLRPAGDPTQSYDTAFNLYAAAKRQHSVAECLRGAPTCPVANDSKPQIDPKNIEITGAVEWGFTAMQNRARDDVKSGLTDLEERGLLARYGKVTVTAGGKCQRVVLAAD